MKYGLARHTLMKFPPSKYDKGYLNLDADRPNETHSDNKGLNSVLHIRNFFILKIHTNKAQHLVHILPPLFFLLKKCMLNSSFPVQNEY